MTEKLENQIKREQDLIKAIKIKRNETMQSRNEMPVVDNEDR